MRKRIAIFVAAATIAAVVIGVKGWAEQPAEKPAVPVTKGDSAPGVTLDAESAGRADIATAPSVPGTRRMETEAIVTALPAQEIIDAAAAVSAAKAQAEKAEAALNASRREHERLKGLHADDRNVSDKALEAAEAVRRGDEAAARAAQTGLDAAVNATRRKWGNPLVDAMLGNAPAFRRIAEGTDVLLRVASPSGTRQIAPPTLAFKTESGRVASARFLSLSPQADPRIQGIAFFYIASADSVVPGATLSASMPAGADEKGATLPETAIVWWQGKAWIYMPTASGSFERREVPGVRQVAEGWFVPGFDGREVVVRGAQSLLSEELRASLGVVGEDGK